MALATPEDVLERGKAWKGSGQIFASEAQEAQGQVVWLSGGLHQQPSRFFASFIAPAGSSHVREDLREMDQ